MNYKQEKMAIPLLDLDKFIFSPPGPMGWALSEYEQTMNEPQDIVLNELSVVENLAVVKEEELVELPTIGLLDLKEADNNQEIATSEESVEEINAEVNSEVTDEIIELEEKEDLVPLELEKTKIKVKIIAPDQLVAPRLIEGVNDKVTDEVPDEINAEVNDEVPDEINAEVNDEVTDEIIELEEKEDLVPLEPEKPKIKVRIIAPHQPVAPKLMAGVEIYKRK